VHPAVNIIWDLLTYLQLSARFSCVQNLGKFLAPYCLNHHGTNKHWKVNRQITWYNGPVSCSFVLQIWNQHHTSGPSN